MNSGFEAYGELIDVQRDWNGMHVSYLIDYDDEQPQDYWPGNHVVEIREPGLHAPYEVEMQDAATLVNTSSELPPWVASNGLREPK